MYDPPHKNFSEKIKDMGTVQVGAVLVSDETICRLMVGSVRRLSEQF
jgi:hypothetical protein